MRAAEFHALRIVRFLSTIVNFRVYVVLDVR